MRLLIILVLLFFSTHLYSQKIDIIVTLIVKFDIKSATIDGFYIKKYVVNIDYEKAKKLNGKKIKITGKVTIEKGIDNKSQDSLMVQGRSEDTKHIEHPKIEILDE